MPLSPLDRLVWLRLVIDAGATLGPLTAAVHAAHRDGGDGCFELPGAPHLSDRGGRAAREWLAQRGFLTRRGKAWICSIPTGTTMPVRADKTGTTMPETGTTVPPAPAPPCRPTGTTVPESGTTMPETGTTVPHNWEDIQQDSLTGTNSNARATHPGQVDQIADLSAPVEPAAATDASLWSYSIGSQPWARDLKRIGAKIGPNNWRTWQGLVEAHGLAVVLAAAKSVPPDRRWPDQTEQAMPRSPPAPDATPSKYAKRLARVPA